MNPQPIELFGIMDKVVLLPNSKFTILNGSDDFKLPEYWIVIGIHETNIILSCDDAIIHTNISNVFKIGSMKPPFRKEENGETEEN